MTPSPSRRLGAWLLCLGLTTGAPGGRCIAADGQADLRRQIAAVDKDWIGAMRDKDAARLSAPYSAQGLFIFPDGRVVVGREAVAALYTARFAHLSKVLAGAIRQEGLAFAGGDMAYEWGRGGLTSVDDQGRTTRSDGPYLTVWRREPDGVWRIVRNLVF